MQDDLTREELLGMLEDFALNWLAHNGLWFLAVEEKAGIGTAIDLDAKAWASFTVIEAKRIMKRHPDPRPGGGIPALAKALSFRLYAFVNRQEILERTPPRDSSSGSAPAACRTRGGRRGSPTSRASRSGSWSTRASRGRSTRGSRPVASAAPQSPISRRVGLRLGVSTPEGKASATPSA